MNVDRYERWAQQTKKGEKKMDYQKYPLIPADLVLKGTLDSLKHVYRQALAFSQLFFSLGKAKYRIKHVSK